MLKPISKQLETAIDERENIVAAKGEKRFIPIIQGENEDYQAQVVTPIVCEGDAIGAVIITTKEPRIKFGEMEQKLSNSAAGFLGKQMEN